MNCGKKSKVKNNVKLSVRRSNLNLAEEFAGEHEVRPSLRSRLERLNTTDPERVRVLFGIRVHDYASLESAREQILAGVRSQIRNRNARRKAANIGLDKWSCLLAANKVDSRAYLIAEGISSELGDVELAISGETVGICWFAAGCRDSYKFRTLVRLAINGETDLLNYKLKGLSVDQIHCLIRGLRATSRLCSENKGTIQQYFSQKALIAIGRLGWVARRAAVAGLTTRVDAGDFGWREGRSHQVKIRVVDLNWSAVCELQDMSREDIATKYLGPKEAMRFLGKTPEDKLATAPRFVREWLLQARPATRDDLVRADWMEPDVRVWEIVQNLLTGFRSMGLKKAMREWKSCEPSCGINRRLRAFQKKLVKWFGKEAADLLVSVSSRGRACGIGISASRTDRGIEKRIKALCGDEITQTLVLPNGQIVFRSPEGDWSSDHHMYRNHLVMGRDQGYHHGDATAVASHSIYDWNYGYRDRDGSGKLAESLDLVVVCNSLIAFGPDDSVEYCSSSMVGDTTTNSPRSAMEQVRKLSEIRQANLFPILCQQVAEHEYWGKGCGAQYVPAELK